MELIDIVNIMGSESPVKWLFYGDSITHGSLHTSGHRCYSELFSERVRYELNRPMDIVINTAFTGHTTRDLLDSFERRVSELNPDIVFIMIGMNDCNNNKGIHIEEFESNIISIVSMVTGIKAVPILQTTCPTLIGESDYKSYSSLPLYMDIIRKVALENKIPLIDHMLFWKENAELHAQWMSNLIHPNGIGHRALARYIYQCFGIYDEEAPSCKLPLA